MCPESRLKVHYLTYVKAPLCQLAGPLTAHPECGRSSRQESSPVLVTLEHRTCCMQRRGSTRRALKTSSFNSSISPFLILILLTSSSSHKTGLWVVTNYDLLILQNSMFAAHELCREREEAGVCRCPHSSVCTLPTASERAEGEFTWPP